MVHVRVNAFSRLLSLVLGQRKNQGRVWSSSKDNENSKDRHWISGVKWVYVSTPVKTTYLNGGTAIYFISTIVAQLPEFLRLDI